MAAFHHAQSRAVIDALERAKAAGARVRIWLGDIETGRNWLDEYDVSGTVSCSMGPIKIPLFTNRYKCARCGEAWQNEDDCTCDDRCPKCNQSTSPYESVDA
jgi:hypothetical protein